MYIVIDLGPNPQSGLNVNLLTDSKGNIKVFKTEKQAISYAEQACSWNYKIVEV